MKQLKTLSKVLIHYAGKSIEISINFRRGNGKLILFIHGLGCSKDSFADVWDFADLKAYSLLTFDLVGYGGSSKPLDFSYDMNEQAEIVKLLLKHFEYQEIHIVAHSMGGVVGLLLAQKIEKQLASFISVEGNLTGADCGLISRTTISYPFETFQNMMFDRVILANQLSEEYSKRLWAKMLKECCSLAFYKTSQSLVEWSDSNELLNLFINLRCRKAYIYGDSNSEMSTLGMLREIKSIAIAGSGHFVMNDNPSGFFTAVAKIVKGSY